MGKSPTKQELLKKIADAKASKVAAAATQKLDQPIRTMPLRPKVPGQNPAKKKNPRSWKSRDARGKTRGRLPDNTLMSGRWSGTEWVGSMEVYTKDGDTLYTLEHQADGLFRLMEEMDIKFWNWFAHDATVGQKGSLAFAPHPPAPAAWVSPGTQEGTGSASQ